MEIEARIDYHGPTVATFDPQKVLERICSSFSAVKIDHTDLAQAEVDWFLKYLEGHPIAEPNRSIMLRQIREKAARNGPVYTFQIEIAGFGILNGYTRRYGVGFKSEELLPSELEIAIIEFLQSLHLGELTCDVSTSHFCIPEPNYQNWWVLAEN